MSHHCAYQKFHTVNLMQTVKLSFPESEESLNSYLSLISIPFIINASVWRINLKELHLYLLERLVCLLLTFWFKKIIFRPSVSISVFILWNIMGNNCLAKSIVIYSIVCYLTFLKSTVTPRSTPLSFEYWHLWAHSYTLVRWLMYLGKSPNGLIHFLCSLL